MPGEEDAASGLSMWWLLKAFLLKGPSLMTSGKLSVVREYDLKWKQRTSRVSFWAPFVCLPS